MSSNLHSTIFGYLPDGRAVESWTLSGQAGLTLEVLAYGGIIRRLLTPDRQGRMGDVVLGYNELDSYLKRHPYFGAITGRVAGRIAGSRFHLEGTECRLQANEGVNHLHGGPNGLDRKLWSARPVSHKDASPSLCLTYLSPHGEENYPGNVHFHVTYTVTKKNSFLIETSATTDRPTPISMTHHSYFNLAGEGSGDVLDHDLCIQADTFFHFSEDYTLLDREESVTGTPDDWREISRLRDLQPKLHLGHGNLYRIRRSDPKSVGRTMVPVAKLSHQGTGRVLEIQSTERMLQLYTGNLLDPDAAPGKSGKSYFPLSGLCLECQDYPNGANRPDIGDIIVRPEKPYHHITTYTFSTESN